MAIEVEIVNGPDLVDILVAAGTLGAALAAAWAAWVANRQNQRLTERKLRFQRGFDYGVGSVSPPRMRVVVTNDSFRPITITDIGFMLPGEERFATHQDAEGTALPATLKDGEAGEWLFDMNTVLSSLVDHGPAVQIYALDNHGVLHTTWFREGMWRRMKITLARRRQRRKFIRQAKKELERLRREREHKT